MSDVAPDTAVVAVAPEQPASLSSRSHWLLFAVAFASMVLFGFVENIKGTVIPPLRDTYQVNYSDIGVMLLAGSFGYLSATFLGGLAGDRYGQKRVLAAGCALIILAALGMQVANTFPLVCGLMFLLNAGFGSLEVGVNSLGARIFVRNSALLMNLTHFFYGAGSMAGPAYAARMLEAGQPWGVIYAFSALLALAVFALLAAARFPALTPQHAAQRRSLREIAGSGKVWLFVIVLSLFVAVEIGTGNWLVSYLRDVHEMGAEESAGFLSLFFLFFTFGRLAGGYVAERLGYVRCILLFALAVLCLDAAGFATGRAGVILFSATGFFISIMYPTFMALIMREFTSGTGSVMGFIITGVAAVNMLMNWVVGQTSDRLGVTAGFASFMLYTVLAIALLLVLNRRLTAHPRAA